MCQASANNATRYGHQEAASAAEAANQRRLQQRLLHGNTAVHAIRQRQHQRQSETAAADAAEAKRTPRKQGGLIVKLSLVAESLACCRVPSPNQNG